MHSENVTPVILGVTFARYQKIENWLKIALQKMTNRGLRNSEPVGSESIEFISQCWTDFTFPTYSDDDDDTLSWWSLSETALPHPSHDESLIWWSVSETALPDPSHDDDDDDDDFFPPSDVVGENSENSCGREQSRSTGSWVGARGFHADPTPQTAPFFRGSHHFLCLVFGFFVV